MSPFTEHPDGIFCCSWHIRSWIFLFLSLLVLCRNWSSGLTAGVWQWIINSHIFSFNIENIQEVFNNILKIYLTLKTALLLPSKSYLPRCYDLLYDLAWTGSHPFQSSSRMSYSFEVRTKSDVRDFLITWWNYMTAVSQLRFYSHICDFTALQRCSKW